MSVVVGERINQEERERLRQEHRMLGPEPRCKTCGTESCTISKLLNRIDYLEDGYRQLQRRLVVFSSPEAMRNEVAIARQVVSVHLHGTG